MPFFTQLTLLCFSPQLAPSPHSCTGHVAAPLTAARATSLPPSQLHGHVAARTTWPPLAAGQATSPPPSQPHTPRCRAPRSCTATSPPSYSCTPCVATCLAAVHTTSSPPSQPHRPRHHVPRSCPPRSRVATRLATAQLHRWPLAAAHAASPCAAHAASPCAVHAASPCATHAASPCASQRSDMDPLGIVYTLCRTLYLSIIAGIYLLNPIIDCNASKHYKHFKMNYKVSGRCL